MRAFCGVCAIAAWGCGEPLREDAPSLLCRRSCRLPEPAPLSDVTELQAVQPLRLENTDQHFAGLGAVATMDLAGHRGIATPCGATVAR